MKKALYVFAVVAMMAVVSCSGRTPEAVQDSVAAEPVEQVVEEAPVADSAAVVADSTAVETPAAQ